MAEQNNLTIAEDDIFAEFEFQPAPRYSALMGLSHVIQIGSYSKTLSASIRCGYIATEHNKIEQLIDLKIATNFSSGNLNAEIVYQALIESSYRKHIEALRERLLRVMQTTIKRLKALGIEVEQVSQAGIFLWAKLPQGMNSAELCKICLQDGVVLAPGQAFSQSKSASQYMRFNVAQSCNPKVDQSLKRVIDILRSQNVR